MSVTADPRLTLACFSGPSMMCVTLSAPWTYWSPRLRTPASSPGAMCAVTMWSMWAAVSATTGLATRPSWVTAVTPALPET